MAMSSETPPQLRRVVTATVVCTGGETATTSSVATPITVPGPSAQAAGDSVTEVNIAFFILLSCIFVKALPAGVRSEQQNSLEEKSLQCCSITGIGIYQFHSLEHISSLCLLPPALQSRRYWFMLFYSPSMGSGAALNLQSKAAAATQVAIRAWHQWQYKKSHTK